MDPITELVQAAREFGAAGAVVALAIYVIGFQGRIITKNTEVLQKLSVLIGVLIQRETGEHADIILTRNKKVDYGSTSTDS